MSTQSKSDVIAPLVPIIVLVVCAVVLFLVLSKLPWWFWAVIVAAGLWVIRESRIKTSQ